MLCCYDIKRTNSDDGDDGVYAEDERKKSQKEKQSKYRSKIIDKNENAQGDKKVKQWNIIQSNKNQRTRSNTVPLTLKVEKKTRKISCLEKCAYRQLSHELEDDYKPIISKLPILLSSMEYQREKKLSRNEQKLLSSVVPLAR